MSASNNMVHPSAIVDTIRIGENTKIWAFVHILEGAEIGRECNICDHVFIENDVLMGDFVTVKSGVYIWNGVTIEDHVFVGPNVSFTNDVYPRSKAHLQLHSQTRVKKGASIGAGSVLVPGVEIGCFAMVGAGTVVTRDVGDYELVMGNPSRPSGYICECAKILKEKSNNKLNCSCGLTYEISPKGVRRK
jgi:acetyltransferase-like isoleucine patch superfamily enzyme